MANQTSPNIVVMPRVLCADRQKKDIVIHPRQEHARRLLDLVRQIRVFRVDASVRALLSWIQDAPPVEFKRLENGALTFSIETPEEGEYTICLGKVNEKGVFEEVVAYSVFRELMVFKIYAVREDLYRLMPYKGDFHMHTLCSDGRETPEYVAAFNRTFGYDFMAVTDHEVYEPSLTAIKAMAGFGTDMLVCPGEEAYLAPPYVHGEGNEVHIVNFGGRCGINKLVADNEEKYYAEVREYEKSVPENYDRITRFTVASSEWVFDRIRENGGIAMFCHPFWRPKYHNYISEDVIDLLLERQKFDVLEVIGGFWPNSVESNLLSIARWQEEQSKGKTIPVAGVSDAHGVARGLAGWFYTVIFAEELSFDSLAAAIRANRSVAVQWLPDTYPVVVGPFRLVKFVHFLLREVYPIHDELCRIEGEIMLRGLAGEENDAAAEIAKRKGTVRRYMEQCWGKTPLV